MVWTCLSSSTGLRYGEARGQAACKAAAMASSTDLLALLALLAIEYIKVFSRQSSLNSLEL